ncbi:uncharacterized protein TNCV_796921 [Trichonephila clavipes]|uniref:Uncharacterized protein n=1 Tax=Trichonephila clavipes TaxID=2585209 RepID=A0A8X7BL85_TRICX|nr:uncharacterized protein TNCV_796921 [Trichonephila clavipes]
MSLSDQSWSRNRDWRCRDMGSKRYAIESPLNMLYLSCFSHHVGGILEVWRRCWANWAKDERRSRAELNDSNLKSIGSAKPEINTIYSCRVSTGGIEFHVKLALIRKQGGPPKIKFQAQILKGRGECFPVPIGLTWERDILVFKPSPCLHNGNEVDD